MSDYIKTAICKQHEKPPGRLWSKWFSFYRLPFYSFLPGCPAHSTARATVPAVSRTSPAGQPDASL